MTRTQSPKPHHMAERADVPCAKCGYDWTRLVVDLSNEDAVDLPIYAVCARCKTPTPERPA